jgi:hypothetical protein
MRAAAFLLILSLAFPFNQALAWWDEGHMQIAYVAYQRLDAPVKDKVDALLKLNGDYALWSAGAPDEPTARLYALVNAATCVGACRPRRYCLDGRSQHAAPASGVDREERRRGSGSREAQLRNPPGGDARQATKGRRRIEV